MTDYTTWFEKVTSHKPHCWQANLGNDEICRDRLVRIPTGLGKTAGVIGPWLFHRVVRNDPAWPRRLVFVLPMRVLVEQTESAIREWLQEANLTQRVGLNVLMGGRGSEPWALDVERPAVLLGTQDMILSRALNRGYGAARGRWPMEFGLLHQDCLWVMDEVQLMDVGLATTTQLAAFRSAEKAAQRILKPTYNWWMSATLQPSWLRTIDFAPELDPLAENTLLAGPPGQALPIRSEKNLVRDSTQLDPKALARLIHTRHQPGKLTLVIVNQVPRAVALFEALNTIYSEGKGKKRKRRSDAPDLRLIHSHFRGLERQSWKDDFLQKNASLPPEGRVIVSTQVVEAGVDISSSLLITDLAPWPSLVQRMGRAARYTGEEAEIIVVGAANNDRKKTLPYEPSAMTAASEALDRLVQAGGHACMEALDSLESSLTENDPDLMTRLYPYDPAHVLRREDLDDLFDTTPDLTGADLDISRYIRSGEEKDASVFWRQLPTSGKQRVGAADLTPKRPSHQELCPVPVHRLRAWLHSLGRPDAYEFDYLEGDWVRVGYDQVRPGMTLLLSASLGGYCTERGWDEKSKTPVPVANHSTQETESVASKLTTTSESANLDTLSTASWKTIQEHGREVAELTNHMGQSLTLPSELIRLLCLAATRHDMGKAHPVFQSAIDEAARAEAGMVGERRDLAKAPAKAWKHPAYRGRSGFRHELVSALMLYEQLRLVAPDHPAFADRFGSLIPEKSEEIDASAMQEVAELDDIAIDLIAWLMAAHHGKVRVGLTSTPHDQAAGHGGIHGVCAGDPVPQLELEDLQGQAIRLPPCSLSLDLASMGLSARYGASWTERCQRLLQRYGLFGLTFLEAVLRAADARASRDGAEERIS